ncbi:hypothetical protein GGI12_001169 [Dipsacomyces acuminosporus]|nr:hypothetical protein GGI12_001169 [Dipsacomyces acuminosporus]
MRLTALAGILVSAASVCCLGVSSPEHDQLPWPVGPGKRAENTNGLRILTQNMFMRPPLIQNKNGDYKDARLDYFIKNILPSYDVVCLQEMFAFASSRRDRLVAAAEKLGFTYSVLSEKKTILDLASDGGLVILSRHPIVDSERIEYQRGLESDFFARKGVLYAKLSVGDGTHVHIYNTHTQASYGNINMTHPTVKRRLSQLHEFHTSLESTLPKYRQPGEAVVLAGDFNVDSRNHVLSDVEHYKYEREVEDGKALSTEGMAMLDVLEGKGIDPKLLGPNNSEAFKGQVVFELHDRLREKLGYRPVTFGNTYVDSKGNPHPRETVLTSESDRMSMQSIDYILWHNPDSDKQRNGAVATLADVAVAPNFTPGEAFTQISDHYGVSALIRIGSKQGRASRAGTLLTRH